MRRLVLVAALLVLTACENRLDRGFVPTAPSAPTVSLLQVTNFGKYALGMLPGQVTQLNVEATFSDGAKRMVTKESTWLGLNASVVTISPAGVATAIQLGVASYHVTYQGFTMTGNVHVCKTTMC